MRLQGKVALVTGGGAGIGEAIAIRFTQEGASVMVADCNREAYASGERTVSRIREEGGKAEFAFTDVAKAADDKNMVKATVQAFGRLDILVNNAGIELYKAITDVTEEDWDTLIDINLKGVFLCTKYAIPEMMKNGGGVIINISSSAGYVGAAMQSTYCASKGGVLLMTRAMAAELRPLNIRVNSLNPSIIDDDMGQQLIKDIEARARAAGLPSPGARITMRQGRLGTTGEVASAALFLASDESSFITGHGLSVDGGLTAI